MSYTKYNLADIDYRRRRDWKTKKTIKSESGLISTKYAILYLSFLTTDPLVGMETYEQF